MAWQIQLPHFLNPSVTNSTAGRYWIKGSGGDAVILYAILCLWALKITVLNSQTLQEYRVRHGVAMRHVDIGLVFNGSCHYTTAGKHQCCL